MPEGHFKAAYRRYARSGISWRYTDIVGVTLAMLVLLLASAQVERAGKLEVFLHCAVDLDAGECACMVTLDGDGREPPGHPRGKDDDLRLEPRGAHIYLEPRHGTLVAQVTPSRSELNGCMAARYSRGRVRVNGLSQGTSICVRTSKGQYAELTIEKAIATGADRALLSYITWER